MPRTGSSFSVLSREVLEAALEGLEAQQRRVDEQIRSVRSMMGARGPDRRALATADSDSAGAVAAEPKKRRKMSVAARRRIAEAQKKRWAEFRKAKEPAKASAGSSKSAKRHIIKQIRSK